MSAQQSTEKAQVRNLATEVIGVDYPEGYVYVGSGDHCVLLCEMNVPKWRNSFALMPDSARRLAADLIRMADQSEQVLRPAPTAEAIPDRVADAILGLVEHDRSMRTLPDTDPEIS